MPLENRYTTEYIENLPEGTHAELINGFVYNMASPGTRHQEIVLSLARKIADHIDSRKGECKIYVAPFAVYLNADNRTYVEPDISVICDRDKITEKGCKGAPDWLIEVVSPTSKKMDYLLKLIKYQSAGVREYWIVDPEKSRIPEYDLEHEDMQEYSFSDVVEGTIMKELSINFSSI